MVRSVLLVHGMGRTPLSMLRLARALRRAGCAPHLFAYFSAWESVDAIVSRLSARLGVLGSGPYAAVGHSLGGLLLRAAVDRLDPGLRRPDRLIMLGTPNRSPRLARRFRRNWWYRLQNGEAGELLANEDRMLTFPIPPIPCTVIAGTRGIHTRWSSFGPDENDGLVAVEETRLAGADEWILVPERHPFLMNHPAARAIVLQRCSAT
ncbi:MAG: esterase/lipase family protein [Gemmatimonadales bacterium]